MASTGINFENLTPDNGAIRDVSQIILASVFAPDALGSVINFFPNVHKGEKMGVIGEFGLMGVPYAGCGGEYAATMLPTNEKEWDINRWQIKEKICFADLESTFVKYMFQSGTQAPDLTSTVYLQDIIAPRLELAIKKLVWRLGFFGDKSAAASGSGGVLKEAANAKYFNTTDGLWKKAYEAVAGGTMKRVTVAANAETTFAKQQTAIAAANVASGIFDQIIANASPALRGMGGTIYCTLALKDALEADLKKNNGGSDLQWKALFDGIQETYYNGVRVLALPMWDEIIKGYEGTAATWNQPYRAIYTVKENLAIGSESSTELAALDIFFDKKDDYNYIKAIDSIGANFIQDDLAVVAY